MAISATTPRAEGSTSQPRELVEWLRARAVTVAAVTLIVIQLWLKAALLGGAYFRQDDYQFMDRALASGFGWGYVMWVDAGHLLPLGESVAWVQARAGLYNWPLTVVVILLLLTGASFAMLRMLRTLFGNRPAILIPLAIFLFSPLSIEGASWWAVAIEILPLEAAMFMAVDSHVRYLRGGRLRDIVITATWLVVGMLAMDKGAVVPVLLLALTVAFFVDKPLEARRYWRAWMLYAAVLAFYAALFFARLPSSSVQPASSGSAGDVFNLSGSMLGNSLLPGAFGGPWRWTSGPGFELAAPPAVLQQLSWALAMIAVIVTSFWRARAWRAWVILLGWVAFADVLPVALGRLGNFPGGFLGAQTRYLTDATGVLALCVGLAFFPLKGERDVYRFQLGPLRQRLTIAVAVLAALMGIGSLWSLESLQSAINANTTAARSYIATTQVALEDAAPGMVIVDTQVPSFIMNASLFGNQSLTSQVVGVMAAPSQHLAWTRTLNGAYANPMIFDSHGQLRPLALAGTYSWTAPRVRSGSYAGRSCWKVTSTAVTVPLLAQMFRFAWTVRVTYTGPAGALAVGFGGRWNTISLPAGTHAVYLSVIGSGNSVRLRLPGGANPVCVTSVQVGAPQPNEAGQAIPAVPIPG